jgi:hypothetical protein
VSPRAQSPLRELCRGVWPVSDTQTEQRRREQIAERIVTLNRDLAERSLRQRRQGWWLAAAALIGSVCLLWLFARGPTSSAPVAVTEAGVRLVAGEASVSRGGVLAPLAAGPLDLSAGEPILITRAGQQAELRLSSDTDLQLAAASRVGLERHDSARGFEERVLLHAGGVALRVPKLGQRGQLAVETADSWVEVHGTQFSVRWVERPPLAPFTEVQVKEGKVLVRSRDGQSRFLTAGEHWSSNTQPSAPEASAAESTPALVVAPVPVPAAPEPPVAAPAPSARAPKPPAVSASELAAQNRLLEGAELARKNGLPALALERLDTLMQRYPEAELAHNARVQRFRLLWSMGRQPDAVRAAREYLERYPHGFAREEAQRYLDADAAAGGAPQP